MAVQQTKGHQITDRLNSLAERSERPSEFEIHGLKREIDQLKQVDVSEHYMLLGMLFSIAGDYEKSVNNHLRSLAYVSDDVTYANYGLSLRRLGRSQESIEPLFKAFEMVVDFESFSDLLRSMVFSGDFSKFEASVDLMTKAHPAIDIANHHAVLSIVEIRDILKSANVPESEFNAAMVLIEGAITEQGCKTNGAFVQPGSFDGVSHAYIELYAEGLDSKTLTRLNDLVADQMISSDFVAWNRMIFNVINHPGADGSDDLNRVA